MDRMREIYLYCAAGMSMLALACSIYQAMNNEKASAGVLATIFFATGLLVFLPHLESIKALWVAARLNRRLGRAEEILGKLQRLAIISGKATYMQMGLGNRFDMPSAKEKQALLDQVNQLLAEMN